MKLIVYGTLQRGHYNHDFLDGCPYLGKITVKGFKLFYSSNGAGFPVARPDKSSSIHGELYEVDDKTLRLCDRLESNGFMYNRVDLGDDTMMYVGNEEYWPFDRMVECPEEGRVFKWQSM